LIANFIVSILAKIFNSLLRIKISDVLFKLIGAGISIPRTISFGLTVAIWTQVSQIADVIVAIVAVNMIHMQHKLFVVPSVVDAAFGTTAIYPTIFEFFS